MTVNRSAGLSLSNKTILSMLGGPDEACAQAL